MEQVITEVSTGYAGGMRLPWQVKMAVKIVLSRLPVSYDVWAKLGVFRHGNIHKGLRRIYEGYIRHLQEAEKALGKTPQTVLELGPGESIGRAVTARLMGAEKMWLADVGDFATRDENYYRDLLAHMKRQGQEFKEEPKGFTRDDILAFGHADYKTNGLEGLKDIPDNAVAFTLSDAVLEHIRRDEFAQTMKELYRLTAPGGIQRHWVDLHDHLGGRLNNLRFSPRFWESKLVADSGFYTNRLSMKEIVAMAEGAGFDVSVPAVNRWPAAPTPRDKMYRDFRDRSEEELRVCTFLIVMRKR